MPSYSAKEVLNGIGNESSELSSRAQQLLEHSLLSELHAVVARALSGLDMFAGHQLSEADLYGADAAEPHSELKASRTLCLSSQESHHPAENACSLTSWLRGAALRCNQSLRLICINLSQGTFLPPVHNNSMPYCHRQILSSSCRNLELTSGL